MLGAYRIVLQKYFGWDVRVFMGHLAIPLFATSLTGFLWFFVWFESSDGNQVRYYAMPHRHNTGRRNQLQLQLQLQPRLNTTTPYTTSGQTRTGSRSPRT